MDVLCKLDIILTDLIPFLYEWMFMPFLWTLKRHRHVWKCICKETNVLWEMYVIKWRNLAVCVCVHAERPLTNLKCSWNQFFMLPWTWPLFTWETGRGRRNGQQKNLNWFYYFTLKLEWLIGALSNSEVSFISWQKRHFFKDPWQAAACGAKRVCACLISRRIKEAREHHLLL